MYYWYSIVIYLGYIPTSQNIIMISLTVVIGVIIMIMIATIIIIIIIISSSISMCYHYHYHYHYHLGASRQPGSRAATQSSQVVRIVGDLPL